MEAKKIRESIKIVPPGKKKCVWMEAGVVSYKLCDNNYDCPTCVYDHAMQVKAARIKEVAHAKPVEVSTDKLNATWIDKMMQLPASMRKCRYMITKEVDRKICPNSYECGNCSYDRIMQERLQAEALPVNARSREAGFELADEFYYHKGHTWARPEYGGRVRIGIDDFAQKLLGKLSRIELPDIGHDVNQDEVGLQVKKNGQTAKLLSPIDGTIVHVNDKLLSNPDLINESPYEDGWIFIVEPTRLRKNLKGLLYGKEAHDYINEEKEKLFSMVNDDLRIAADGGGTVEDICKELDEKDWGKLIKTFFKI